MSGTGAGRARLALRAWGYDPVFAEDVVAGWGIRVGLRCEMGCGYAIAHNSVSSLGLTDIVSERECKSDVERIDHL